MILSAEALDIIAYLKTAPGKFISLREISLKAGGRRLFEESPGWARNLMQPLLEAGLIEVNERGHYRVPASEPPPEPTQSAPRPPRTRSARIVGDDYFPAKELKRIVGGDYFPIAEMD
jgi:hypothetical protein